MKIDASDARIRTIQIKLIDPVYQALKKKKGSLRWDEFIIEIIKD